MQYLLGLTLRRWWGLELIDYCFSISRESRFMRVRQKAGIRLCCNYCPLILDTYSFCCGPMPFRFDILWISHLKFNDECEM